MCKNLLGIYCVSLILVFSKKHEVLTGYHAVAQAEHNPMNTIFDAKRFIGKPFTREQLLKEQQRYPFKVVQMGIVLAQQKNLL